MQEFTPKQHKGYDYNPCSLTQADDQPLEERPVLQCSPLSHHMSTKGTSELTFVNPLYRI